MFKTCSQQYVGGGHVARIEGEEFMPISWIVISHVGFRPQEL